MGIEEAWERIVRWCEECAPATAEAVGAPAAPAAIAAVEAAFGWRWPADLRAWYAQADGAARTPAGYLLPGARPLPLDEVREHALMWRQVREQVMAPGAWDAGDPHRAALGGAVEDPRDAARLDALPAGTMAGLFLPSFVPVAEDQSGSGLVVDLRAGAQHGRVTVHDKVEADAWGHGWPSVTALLDAVATALTTGSPVGFWRPYAVDGRLEWDVVRASGDRSALDVDEQVADRDVEGAGQPPQAEHVEAALTALDLADEGPVHAGRLGQLLLGPAATHPEQLDPHAERLEPGPVLRSGGALGHLVLLHRRHRPLGFRRQ